MYYVTGTILEAGATQTSDKTDIIFALLELTNQKGSQRVDK